MRSTKRGPGGAAALKLSAASGEISFTLLWCREMDETDRRWFLSFSVLFFALTRLRWAGQDAQSSTHSETVAT